MRHIPSCKEHKPAIRISKLYCRIGDQDIRRIFLNRTSQEKKTIVAMHDAMSKM